MIINDVLYIYNNLNTSINNILKGGDSTMIIENETNKKTESSNMPMIIIGGVILFVILSICLWIYRIILLYGCSKVHLAIRIILVCILIFIPPLSIIVLIITLFICL